MESRALAYICIFITVLCTAVGQLMLKHATNNLGQMPANLYDGAIFLFKALLNIYVIAGFALAFIASLAWIAAVSKLELSFAYPFTSLGFVAVMLFSALFLNEPITPTRFIGVITICLGVYLISRS
ncbi:MAG: EamA family transporter [Acidobacteriota bacterium]